jgi:hypothetical protein
MLVAASAGCSRDGASPSEGGNGPGDHPAEDPESAAIDEITEVVEALSAAEPTGFDPAAWSTVTDPSAVLPSGASLEVADGTVVLQGEEASADVTMSVPGQPDTRHWAFLHRVDDAWVVYGTLPLEVAP